MPHKFRAIALIPSTLALTACLQVELYGPVSDSSVTIRSLDGEIVVSGLHTSTPASAESSFGTQAWAELEPALQLLFLGTAEIPDDGIEEDALYIVSAEGGYDHDGDRDRLPDETPRQVRGRLHAVVPGDALKSGTVRVNLLTEAIYRMLLPGIDALPEPELALALDDLAAEVVTDIDDDGEVNYSDVLAWNHLYRADRYIGARQFLERLQRSVSLGRGDDILLLDSYNVVARSRWKPARDSGPFADRLVACSAVFLYEHLCDLDELPLIGQETPRPSVEDLMRRVVASHDWMARRLENAFAALPEDALRLARSVTAIIIDDKIRPPHYNPDSGAVYLDADFFWLTAEEQATIVENSDFREDFGTGLSFAPLWRYVRDNRSVYDMGFHVTDGDGTRSLEAALPGIAAVLFHELAHATDYFPANNHELLSALDSFDGEFPPVSSNNLSATYPLASNELRDIAAVLYRGSTATDSQKALSASEVGDLFERDVASTMYSYSAQVEDYAMMIEEYLMYKHYGLRQDQGFVHTLDDSSEFAACSDLRLGWGVRGRIGDADVLPRLRLALGSALPQRNHEPDIGRIPAPVAMNTEYDWCENLDLDGVSNTAPVPRSMPANSDAVRIRRHRFR